jgi:hypothetical protein
MNQQHRWNESEEIHMHLLFDDAKLPINIIAEIMKLPVKTIIQKLVELKKIDDPNSVMTQFIELEKKYIKENNGKNIYNQTELLCEIISGMCKRIEVLEKKCI